MATIRGFGYMKIHDPKRQKEISSIGGKSAQKKGLGHSWSSEEAVIAGKLSAISRAKKRESQS